MRITIINPPWQFYNPIKLYPLGLSYLGAMLRKHECHPFSLIDLNVTINEPQNIIKRAINQVENTKPDVVAIICWIVQVPFVLEFVNEYKKRHPEVTIILGGVQASASFTAIMQLCRTDIIVHSEGEETFIDLITTISNDRDLKQVSGISFRQGANIVTTKARKLIADLNGLPFPAYDLLPPIDVYQPLNKRFVFSIVASRGCSHHCQFCSGHAFWRYQRWRSPENVIEEINWLKSWTEVGFIRFEDDDFAINKVWLSKLLTLIEGHLVPFSCLARFDSLDETVIKLLARAGCLEVYHGLESASPRLLKLLQKDVSADVDLTRIKEILNFEVANGIAPTVSAMIGIPTETEQEMQSTIEFLAGLRAIGVKTQLWILTPYPGTDIVKRFGHMISEIDRWKEFNQFDVFSEVARDAYSSLLKKYKSMVPDHWMFKNEAGVVTTGLAYAKSKGRLMGVIDFV